MPRQGVVAADLVGALGFHPDECACNPTCLCSRRLLTEPRVQLGCTGIERSDIVAIDLEVLAAKHHESGTCRVPGAIQGPGKRCVRLSRLIQARHECIEEVRRNEGPQLMLGEYLSGAFLNGRAHEIAHRN